MKLFTIFLSGSFLLLQAQPVSVGVKGGFVLTDATRYSRDESRNYTVGPTVEFKLPRNFGIETGFLYKRIGTNERFISIPGGQNLIGVDGNVVNSRTRGNSFEIPVVGKYYFTPTRAFAPYLGLGVAMRRAWQTTEGSVVGPNDIRPSGYTFRNESLSPWGAGAVSAAGVQFRYGHWKISPEFRYTRWSREAQRIPRNPNQVEFLLGVSF
jgi:hypothetical protein